MIGTCKDNCSRGLLFLHSCQPPPSAICQSGLDDLDPHPVSDGPQSLFYQISEFIDRLRDVRPHSKKGDNSQHKQIKVFPLQRLKPLQTWRKHLLLRSGNKTAVDLLFVLVPAIRTTPRSAEHRVPEPEGHRLQPAAQRPEHTPLTALDAPSLRARRPQSRSNKRGGLGERDEE